MSAQHDSDSSQSQSQESDMMTRKRQTSEAYNSSVSLIFMKRGNLVDAIQMVERTHGPSPIDSLLGMIKSFIAASDHYYNSSQEYLEFCRDEQEYKRTKRNAENLTTENGELVNMASRFKCELVSRDRELNACREVLDETVSASKRIVASVRRNHF